jgi:hypothetical protein
MVTATKPPAPTTEPPIIRTANDHPLVVAANAALTPIRQASDEAVTRANQYHADLSPFVDRDGGHVDVLARMEATLNRDRANLDVLRLNHELTMAQHAVDVAREVARDDIEARYKPELRAAVAELKAALLAARTANAKVQRIQMDQHSATTRPFDGAGVATLNALVEHWLSIHAADERA